MTTPDVKDNGQDKLSVSSIAVQLVHNLQLLEHSPISLVEIVLLVVIHNSVLITLSVVIRLLLIKPLL